MILYVWCGVSYKIWLHHSRFLITNSLFRLIYKFLPLTLMRVQFAKDIGWRFCYARLLARQCQKRIDVLGWIFPLIQKKKFSAQQLTSALSHIELPYQAALDSILSDRTFSQESPFFILLLPFSKR